MEKTDPTSFRIGNTANGTEVSSPFISFTLFPCDHPFGYADGEGKNVSAFSGEGSPDIGNAVLEDGNGITLTQTVSGAAGVSEISFSLFLPDPYCVIVPAWNGVRLSEKHPLFWTGWTDKVVYGDTTLQMQMVLLEGKDGGALIFAEDDGSAFKSFQVSRKKGGFLVTVGTIPQAPFDRYSSYTSVPWHIVPYTGKWYAGAAIYREYVDRAFGIPKILSTRPAWAGDISLFVLTDLFDRKELDALASRFDPRKTLLQVPAWRKEPYDVNWPDYTPRPDFAETVAYAHQLGFRVQLHCNMNGCQMEREEYERFRAFHCEKPFSGPVNADFSDPRRHYLFAQMNPAAKEWRQFMADTLLRAASETGADSIHLDESLMCHNDRKGPFDGMTSMQGNVAYHKELADKAYPRGICIGGEGITDCNARYGIFQQSHVYAVDGLTLSPEQLEQIVPLTAAVYPEVMGYHWPGLPVTAKGSGYLAWYVAGLAIGHFPTLMRESAYSLSKGANEIADMIFREAEWVARTKPMKCFADWDEDTLMRWTLADGSHACFRREGAFFTLYENENDENSAITRVRLEGDTLTAEPFRGNQPAR